MSEEDLKTAGKGLKRPKTRDTDFKRPDKEVERPEKGRKLAEKKGRRPGPPRGQLGRAKRARRIQNGQTGLKNGQTGFKMVKQHLKWSNRVGGRANGRAKPPRRKTELFLAPPAAPTGRPK